MSLNIPRKSYPMAGMQGIEGRIRAGGFDPPQQAAIAGMLRDVLNKQTQDERLNYDAIEAAVNGTSPGGISPFDAVVDNSLAASVPASFHFKSIHEAVTYCGGTAAMVRVRILVRYTGTDYSETIAFAVGTLVRIYIEGESYFGQDNDTLQPGGGTQSKPVWKPMSTTAVITSSAGLSALICRSMRFEFGYTPATTGGFFGKWDVLTLFESDVITAGSSDRAMFVSSGGTSSDVEIFTAYDCFLQGLYGSSTDTFNQWSLYHCVIEWFATTAKTLTYGDILAMGCVFYWKTTGAVDFTVTYPGASFYTIGCNWRMIDLSGGSVTRTLTLSFTGTPRVWLHGGGADAPNTHLAMLSVTFSQRPLTFVYDIAPNRGSITVPASGTPNTDAGTVALRGAIGSFDVAGPAIIDVTVQNPVTLRGQRINANLSLLSQSADAAAPPTVALSTVGLLDSHISVAGKFTGLGTQVQAYALDAASLRNIFDFAGASTFPIASVDAGAGNIVRAT